MASLVAVSRVDDYWHHWQDVFAGGLLGIFSFFFPTTIETWWSMKGVLHIVSQVIDWSRAGLIVATFCYHQFFPPPYDDQGIPPLRWQALLCHFCFYRHLLQFWTKNFHASTNHRLGPLRIFPCNRILTSKLNNAVSSERTISTGDGSSGRESPDDRILWGNIGGPRAQLTSWYWIHGEVILKFDSS